MKIWEAENLLWSQNKDKEDKHFSIRLPYEFVRTYMDALEEGIQYTGDYRVQLAGECQELQINYSKMEATCHFRHSWMYIASADWSGRKSWDHLPCGRFRRVSLSVQCCQGKKWSQIQAYVIPHCPELAVVRGAVLFHKKEAVHTRRVDATYGVAVNTLFDAQIHDNEYK